MLGGREQRPTSLAKGSLRISKSVERWYLRISRSATVPGRKRCFFGAAPGAPAAPAAGERGRQAGGEQRTAAERSAGRTARRWAGLGASRRSAHLEPQQGAERRARRPDVSAGASAGSTPANLSIEQSPGTPAQLSVSPRGDTLVLIGGRRSPSARSPARGTAGADVGSRRGSACGGATRRTRPRDTRGREIEAGLGGGPVDDNSMERSRSRELAIRSSARTATKRTISLCVT